MRTPSLSPLESASHPFSILQVYIYCSMLWGRGADHSSYSLCLPQKLTKFFSPLLINLKRNICATISHFLDNIDLAFFIRSGLPFSSLWVDWSNDGKSQQHEAPDTYSQLWAIFDGNFHGKPGSHRGVKELAPDTGGEIHQGEVAEENNSHHKRTRPTTRRAQSMVRFSSSFLLLLFPFHPNIWHLI